MAIASCSSCSEHLSAAEWKEASFLLLQVVSSEVVLASAN